MGMIRCINCGQYVSYASIDTGRTIHRFIPNDSIVSGGNSEYTCEKCTSREEIYLSDVMMDIARNNLKKYKEEADESFLTRASVDKKWDKY